jgi:hypothetical protein
MKIETPNYKMWTKNRATISNTEIQDLRLKEEYKDLKTQIKIGFPNEKSNVKEHLRQFFQYRHDLYVDSNNFIVFKDRLLIPKAIRKIYLPGC